MRSLVIEDDGEIQKFTNQEHWISYFPSHIKRDLEMMGLKVRSVCCFHLFRYHMSGDRYIRINVCKTFPKVEILTGCCTFLYLI